MLSRQSRGSETPDEVDATSRRLSKTRMSLDLQLQYVKRIVHRADVPTTVIWTPPAVGGGYQQRIDLVSDLFHLQRYGIDLDAPCDVLLQAMGVYQHDGTSAWIRTLNPLYWIGQVIDWIAQIPFRLFGFLGGDAERLSKSLFGRLLEALLKLTQVVLTFLSIAEKLGLLDFFRNLVLKLFVQLDN